MPDQAPRLLVVDDDTGNIRLLSEVLRGMGTIHFATDGASAIQAAGRVVPDLVLLDAEMPGMSGFEVCAALKDNPATADASIIFVTAHSNLDHETRALSIGAVDFIAKPISPPIVRARVYAHLTLKLQADMLRHSARAEAAKRQSAVLREAATAARLDATREAVAALVDASPRPLAILRLDDTGKAVIGWANDQFGALFGGAVAERRLSELLPGVDLGTPTRLDVTIGGAEVELLFTTVRSRHDQLVMLTAHDRTAERQAARKEAERHRLEALGRMAGRIAHEINNILQPIMSHASLARHASHGNMRAREHIEEIQDGVRQGREIVRSVLALAGGQSTARQPRVLEAELTRLFHLIGPGVPDRIRVETDLRPTGGMVGLAPADLLQIVNNLMNNAIDAISDSGVLRVATRPLPVDAAQAGRLGVQPGGYAELSLSDTGTGMDADTLARALDPFFTTKPMDKGSGLGLSTVRALVDSMGGSISLASAPGEGTTVRVVFPLIEGS